MSFFVVSERCNGCLACVQNCPATALDFVDEADQRRLLHNMARCARCGTCWRVCPQDAVEFQHLLVNSWDVVVTLPLVRCRVCGDVVHTTPLAQSLAAQPGPLGELAEPLCPAHRARKQASAQHRRGS